MPSLCGLHMWLGSGYTLLGIGHDVGNIYLLVTARTAAPVAACAALPAVSRPHVVQQHM